VNEIKYQTYRENYSQQPLFGEWLKDRRKKLDLTQAELAQRAGCSVPALRKIEAGERRPSKQLAGLLARSLEIPSEDQTTFIKVARGELNVERLFPYALPPHFGYEPASKPHPSPGNLPGMLTPFLGRGPELAAIGQLLRDPQCRLLSITGPGGIGKTRLAIEVVDHHKDVFPDGIWFVSLAPLNSSEFLISAIADALDFRFQDPVKPHDQLLGYLRDKRALLILDNAEHLLDGIGLFTEILENSPQVKLLVTSRERLNLRSEWVFEIQGLPVPDSDQAEQFEGYSSVAIFLQTARRTRADFEFREADRRWVVRICQILDGMPLGIELAAAWVGLLSCKEIAREIEHNLDFLTVTMRDLPERHRSLRATLDHSWNLMNSEEKAALSRLSVFQGTFRRDAAESICGANLSVLSSLKDKSLLHRTNQGYYDLHELIRQYAALRLAEDAREDERVKDRHAIYYAERLKNWEIALKSSRQVETLNEMAIEIDNLRQAWQRMVTRCEFNCHRNSLFSPSMFHSSLFSLSLFFELRCRYWEAVNLFGQALETLKATKQSVSECGEIQHIDSVLGLVTAYLGHHQYLMHYLQAHESLEEALRLLENDPIQTGKAQAQIILAWIYQAQGNYQKAADLFQESSAVFQQERDDWWYTLSIGMLAMVTLALGNINESVMLFQESLSRIEAGDLRLGVHVRTGLGYANFFLGDYSEAERLLLESLGMSYELGNKRQVAYNYRLLGQVALALGQSERAKNYFQECVTLLGDYGESPDLALGLIYLGRCLTASQETEAARREFKKVIQIGQALNIFYLTYWGLINLARISMEEDQLERAYEMALVLQRYSVDSKVVQNDYAQLLADLQTRLAPQQIQAAIDQTEGHSIDTLLDLI
jgi:predicted ATPase/transcriptional regulator with XRE-family HTH domain/Tfp pilus assembly protein PilF